MAEFQSKLLPPLSEKDIARFWASMDKSGGSDACWLWRLFTCHYGYGTFRISLGRRTLRAHRIAYFLGHGIDAGSQFVLHKCDNPPCCNPSHLFLGDQADNVQDAKAKGRLPVGDAHYLRIHPEKIMRGENHPNRKHPEKMVRGELSPASKLTEADVVEIRRLWASGSLRQGEIAAKFGIEQTNVGYIVRRKSWRHVV